MYSPLRWAAGAGVVGAILYPTLRDIVLYESARRRYESRRGANPMTEDLRREQEADLALMKKLLCMR
jgi:hypothetical protein